MITGEAVKISMGRIMLGLRDHLRTLGSVLRIVWHQIFVLERLFWPRFVEGRK